MWLPKPATSAPEGELVRRKPETLPVELSNPCFNKPSRRFPYTTKVPLRTGVSLGNREAGILWPGWEVADHEEHRAHPSDSLGDAPLSEPAQDLYFGSGVILLWALDLIPGKMSQWELSQLLVNTLCHENKAFLSCSHNICLQGWRKGPRWREKGQKGLKRICSLPLPFLVSTTPSHNPSALFLLTVMSKILVPRGKLHLS